MEKSDIIISVGLDEERLPDSIEWKADDADTPDMQKAKAMMLSLWDGADKTAMRIDLWTKGMMIDEMNDFYFQTMMTMADSYHRATGDEELSTLYRDFAKDFYTKAQEKLK